MEGGGTPQYYNEIKSPVLIGLRFYRKGCNPPPPPVLQGDKKPSAYRVKIVPKLFLCAYIKSCFCPVFTCLKSVKK